ncbi:S-layer homology domain-containing protein [Sedimentibacter sp.]|uniref:S-layer homology domain-containing protein n=1 Tax=Sedimentibacter sp. TaxID=1960295 RepID=UPI0028A7EA6E|nr:S-layer homology domain-containing protein [Sedimentibacter sp.]
MKKVLSLVLVIAMVLSSMSFAFAAKFEDVADTDYAEAIDTLFALGVITGYEDGTYRPDNKVTRAEMAKLMVELLGYGDLVAGSKSNFVDTQGHWADQWIALAAGRGIVIGTGDGKFNPDGIVTYDQVLTMLVRGLGYTDSSNELKNMTWPTNFKVKAAELNITKNVDMRTAEADRGGVAQAMYNALDQQLVKVNSDGDIVREYISVGSNDRIPVLLVSRIANADYDFEVGFEHINPNDKNYAGDKVDLTKYLFQSVEAYFNKNKDKEVVYVGKVNSLTYSEDFESIDNANKELEVGDYTFDVAGSSVSYNNVEEKIGDLNTDNLEDAKITVVLAKDETRIKNNAEVVGVIVEKANAYAQVEEEYKAGATKIDEIFLPVKNDKVDSANLIIKGDAEELEDIEVDDIVAAYAPLGDDATVEATDKLTLVVTRNTIEGEVTGKAADAYYVNRTKYEVNEALGLNNNADLDVKDEATFFLDQDGKIIAYVDESGSTSVYAVIDEVIEGRYEVNSANDKATVIREPKVKLHTASNETITYVIDVDLKKASNGNWVVDDEDLAKVISVNNTRTELREGRIEFITNTVDALENLVEYKLNKSNEVTFIKNAGRTLEETRTSSSSFVLAPSAVIFDGEGKVISEDKLPSKVAGLAVYRNGKIVALYVPTMLEEGTEYFAYVTAAGEDTDADKNEIERLTAYIDGAKKTLYTDDEDMLVGKTMKKVYALVLNDDGIVTKLGTTPTGSGIKTASNVDTRRSEITVNGVGTKFVAQGATIIEVDGSDVYVRNLNAIKKDTTSFEYYLDSNGEIKFIIITTTAAPSEGSKLEAVTVADRLIQVSGEIYEVSNTVRLIDKDGNTVQIGATNVLTELTNAQYDDAEVKLTLSSGIVTRITLVD